MTQTTPSSQVELATAFLEGAGAATIPHPGGTLLAHLGRTRELLEKWGAPNHLILAGLCHAVYGTDGFPHQLLDLSGRTQVRDLIGDDAERTVYLYGSCDRRFLFPQLGRERVDFRDRFTGEVFEPEPAALTDFMELTFANELDVACHSPEFAAHDWPLVARVFSVCRPLVSAAAWDAYAEARPQVPADP